MIPGVKPQGGVFFRGRLYRRKSLWFFSLPFCLTLFHFHHFPSYFILSLFLHSIWEMRIQQSPFMVVDIKPEQRNADPTYIRHKRGWHKTWRNRICHVNMGEPPLSKGELSLAMDSKSCFLEDDHHTNG